MQRLALLFMAAAVMASPAQAEGPAKIYGQQLIEKTLAQHPDVAGLAAAVAAPKSSEVLVVASSLGTTGQRASADDLKVISSGAALVRMDAAAGRAEVRLPLLDLSRRPLGSLEVVLTTTDQTAAVSKAAEIRDAIGRRISHIGNLLEPARFDTTTPVDSYARFLVDQTLAQHPNVIILALHATPPNSPDDVIVGSNIGRIGKKADEDDMNVIKTGTPKLEFNETNDRYEVEHALKDVSGDIIGAVGVVFAYKPGDDTTAHQKEAEAIRDALSKRILSPGNLVDPFPYEPGFSTNTYAQSLVDRTLAQHPELLILALHATPPGSSQNVIVASNIGRIGKKADEDDLRVIQTGAPNLEVNSSGKRYEVALPLLDASGARIGVFGQVFAYGPGVDKAGLYRQAIKIQDELRGQIKSAAQLVQPQP
jgi:hypothetical protein